MKLFAFSFVIIFLAGCGIFMPAAEKDPEVFIAALWNVQALFDGSTAGNEYGEYLDTAGWTTEKYAARVTAISRAILEMGSENREIQSGALTHDEDKSKNTIPLVPGLVGLVEIENAGILDDLAYGGLAKNGFYWTAFAKNSFSSLGIGFLSRFPITDTRVHSITIEGETAPRPVLEIRVEPCSKPLVFLLSHWKSKLGGDEATEETRRSSARVILRRLREIMENEPGTPVIVMGDLNENHDEFYRRGSSQITALLPDHPDAAEAAKAPDLYAKATASAKAAGKSAATSPATRDFLVISHDRPPQSGYFSADTAVLFSPWEEENSDVSRGSYFYKGGWETIDHFLLSDTLFTGTDCDYADFLVLNRTPFINSRGAPNSYMPRNGGGLSDHLPLLLYLHYVE